ncbi:MAG: hypothetical protein CMI54_07585 [Parcubacteria group bacterium]|nr:hypothetical protein [Parcubacteria group bacterium]
MKLQFKNWRNCVFVGMMFIISACWSEGRQSEQSSVGINNFATSSVDFDADIGVEEDIIATQDINCPNRDNTAGLSVGSTFLSVQFPNAEWEPVSIKSLCGSKAILVISATEWCTACLTEFDYLAMISSDWKDRGGEVYYTLFEDGARQPASQDTLKRFEEYMLGTYGSIPFRVLADPASTLPRSIGTDSVTLPISWLLNEEMEILEYAEGTNAVIITNWMESLL